MKLDRKQIADILNVQLKGLETIETRKQLQDRLKDANYKLIKKIKEGRNNYYIVEKLKGVNQQKKKLYNDICKYAYKTNRPNQFGIFFKVRTGCSDQAITNKELSELTQIGTKTLTKWNDCLLDKGIIVKDGFFYFYISMDKKIRQCSKEEYKTFWKNKKRFKKREQLQERYLNGEITLNQYTDKVEDYAAAKFYVESKYYYRIKKYKTNTDNQLYIDTNELLDILNINSPS
jgi:hypothetical protein